MRKLLATSVAIVLTILFQQNFAVAAQNNNCNQVRSKLSEAESNFSAKLGNFRTAKLDQPGTIPDLYMLASDITDYRAWKARDPIKEIYKIAISSINCFDSKQKARISRMKKESLSTYLVIEKRPLYSTREICNRLTGNDFEMQCFQREVDSFSIYKKYAPINSP